MIFTRALCTSTLAAGIGAASLFGLGIGTASAAPCNSPGTPPCGRFQDDHGHPQGHDDRGPAPADWQNRGPDQGRRDHQPFNWNGHLVTPMPAGNGAGWGFWFLGTWIPL